MSVNKCNRNGCKNIMCSILVLGDTRYICNECFNELRVKSINWPTKLSKSNFNKDVKAFMDSEKIYEEEKFNTTDLLDNLLLLIKV